MRGSAQSVRSLAHLATDSTGPRVDETHVECRLSDAHRRERSYARHDRLTAQAAGHGLRGRRQGPFAPGPRGGLALGLCR